MRRDAALIDAVNDLAVLIESATQPKLQILRDKATTRPMLVIQKLARARFRKQRAAVLAGHALRKIHAGMLREAEGDEREAEIAAAIGPSIYGQPVTALDQKAYAKAIVKAIDTGAAAISDHLSAANPETESFVSEYLKDGGFTRLTGELDKTTVERLAGTIADAYEQGADFDGVVSAVKSEFAYMATSRAQMIAQTELNDAYNQSIMHFGEEAGATKKSWDTDLAPCIICIENELAGLIDIDEDFPSGDDAPPGHPNCMCSLMVHA